MSNEKVDVEKVVVDDYYEASILGQGSYGTAYLCNKRNENNNKYVVKLIDLSYVGQLKKKTQVQQKH